MNKLITLCTLTTIFFRVYGQQDLVKPFEECGINGSITIYDNNAKKWISSNINDSHYATLPASTFKIINTLIALDAGVITDENEIIKWPGVTDTIKYGYRPDIYHDMSIKEAFRLSAGWVYVELAKKIGKETYRQYLTDCQYGNVDLSVDDDDFWNFGHFTISPANQIEILKGVYEETLPFSNAHFNILKQMMLNEQTDTYNVYAKTGWTRYQEKDTGWWVGYIERSDNVYFFATRLIQNRKTKNPNFGECRKEITRAVLKQMNIIE